MLVPQDSANKTPTVEIGPIGIGDIKLGIGDLPQKVIRDTHLARGSNHQFGIGQSLGIETCCKGRLIDIIRRDFSGSDSRGKITRSANDLCTSPVVNRKSKNHSGVVATLIEAVFKNVTGLFGQSGNISQKDYANIFTLEKRKLVNERLGKKVHEDIDLMLRTIPIFG